MKLSYLILIGLMAIISCNKIQSEKLEYVMIKRNANAMKIKTRVILSHVVTDSFNIISYKTTFDDNTYNERIKFSRKPEFDTLTNYKFSGARRYELDNRQYEILRYLYDDAKSSDEEMFLFYSPDFGVLDFKSPVWGYADRLIKTGDPEKDRIIFYLNERIVNDRDFYW